MVRHLGLSRTVIYTIAVVVVALIVGLVPIIYFYAPHPSHVVPTTTSAVTTNTTVTNTTTTVTKVTNTTTTNTTAVSPAASLYQSLFSEPVGPITISPNEVNELESYVPSNAEVIPSNNTIIFNGTNVDILILAGPNNNYLSFQVFGLLNPTIEVPVGSVVKIIVLVVSVLPHSFGLTTKGPPYSSAPTPEQYPAPFPGSQMPSSILTNGLPPESSTVSGYVLEFNATTPGEYWYLCFVPGHAASGMYGEFIVYK
jgi:hypothetical protein